jgi:hypothetical protein
MAFIPRRVPISCATRSPIGRKHSAGRYSRGAVKVLMNHSNKDGTSPAESGRITKTSASGLHLFEARSPTPPIPCLRFAGSLTVSAQDSGPGGSLLLSCKTLSFSTSCRFSPGHRNGDVTTATRSEIVFAPQASLNHRVIPSCFSGAAYLFCLTSVDWHIGDGFISVAQQFGASRRTVNNNFQLRPPIVSFPVNLKRQSEIVVPRFPVDIIVVDYVAVRARNGFVCAALRGLVGLQGPLTRIEGLTGADLVSFTQRCGWGALGAVVRSWYLANGGGEGSKETGVRKSVCPNRCRNDEIGHSIIVEVEIVNYC